MRSNAEQCSKCSIYMRHRGVVEDIGWTLCILNCLSSIANLGSKQTIMLTLRFAVLTGIFLILARFLFIIAKSFSSSTRHLPGPFWARFTRLWYFKRVALGGFEQENIALHRKHGPIVRLAPNMFSIDLPESVNTIYGIGSKLPKAEWYEGWKHPSPDAWTLFPDRDIKRHAQTRRVFQGLYSMSSLVSYEKYVDECADILLNRMSICSKRHEPINMGHWFQCYAFDVIGNITFSKPFGFLNRGEDISGILQALNKVFAYSTLIGIFPSLHPYIYSITSALGIGGAAGRTYLIGYVKDIILKRRLERDANNEKAAGHTHGMPDDFLEKIMVKNKDAPSKVTDYHIFMMSMSNIIAGSDTTAISLSAILYYLLKYPDIMSKLREEIDQSIKGDGHVHLSFKESLEMPYWQAVMKEALRLHPATGLPLWRDVTEGGLHLNGQFFPEGTTIGINTWTAHYNEDVFGKDAAVFRPERWLEAEKEGGDRLNRMNAYYFPVSTYHTHIRLSRRLS
jgi:cytochrome P450